MQDAWRRIHDPELERQLSGEAGRLRQERAELFWSCLHHQLGQFTTNCKDFRRQHPKGSEWTLPSLLRAVKEIMESLISDRDREQLEEAFNVELIMQQIEGGIIELERLPSWMAAFLKRHSAPTRDELIDQMYNELSNGIQISDMNEIVKGMRRLLGVLEAMKLDLINHQISCSRLLLIEQSIGFEQQYFYERISAQEMPIDYARQWYDRAVHYSGDMSIDDMLVLGEAAAFFDELTASVFPSFRGGLPDTFDLDKERILKLESDICDVINHGICMRVYEDLTASYEKSRAAEDWPTPTYLASRTSSLALGDGVKACKPYKYQLDQNLLGLLHTAPLSDPIERWQGLKQSLATEIFRFTGAQHTLIEIENMLQSRLYDSESSIYREVENVFQIKVFSELIQQVKKFKNLSCVDLFSIATDGRIEAPAQTWEDDCVKDIATRLAHLGILHWRIWSRLVY